MANVIGFGLDIAVNIAVLATAFGAQDTGPVAMVGTGSTALGPDPPVVPNKEQAGGPMPQLTLYDVHGNNFAADQASGVTLVSADNKKATFGKGLDSNDPDTNPEYMRLFAFQNNAVCISYVTVTGTDGAHTSWHAGYAKQCGVPAWYPSPEIFPTTSFRPGCVWLTNDVDFPGLQAISFKLTDLSFQSDTESEAALEQFVQAPETLCNAPGRMAFWKTSDFLDCIPFYNFIEEKDPNTGFDVDFGKIETGHTLNCKPTGSMYIPSNLPSPSLSAAVSTAPPPPLPPATTILAAASTTIPPPPPPPASTAPPPPQSTIPPPSQSNGAGNFGGIVGEIPATVATTTPPAVAPTTLIPPPSSTNGAGNSGGIVSEIPPTAETTIPPVAATTTPPGVIDVSFNPGGPTGVFQAFPRAEPTRGVESKVKIPRRSRADHKSILQRRAILEKKRDFCVDRLAISHLPDHSATEVCESTISWGPDFVSVVEGLYCDMCERMLWSLCTGPTATYCFDLVARELRLPEDFEARDQGEDWMGDKELAGLRKRYTNVDEWKA